MCGIFGIAAFLSPSFGVRELKHSIDILFRISESRGKEASGLAFLDSEAIRVAKEPVSASRFLKTHAYRDLFKTVRPDARPVVCIGHARLVTNGKQTISENNQPVVKNGIVCVHNGIIVNDENLWARHANLCRDYEVDTEIIPALVGDYCRRKSSPGNAAAAAIREIIGATSVALLFNDLPRLVLATNNGSLYIGADRERTCLVFASERQILRRFIRRSKIPRGMDRFSIFQVAAGMGYEIYIQDLRSLPFEIEHATELPPIPAFERRIKPIRILPSQWASLRPSGKETVGSPVVWTRKISRAYELNEAAIEALKRCTRCLLPETFPFIQFDSEGVCNHCRGYQKLAYEGEESLRRRLAPHRRGSGKPDSIVAFSGGRDSSYGLHYVKNVLGMTPIAFTYDWGMVTDLARRNISRICGKLGIEHILVSADIGKKRNAIRKNVVAWLKKPRLGTIPLFMAGDKQYFYYANALMKENGLDLLVMSENRLERTHFKHGFCGVDYRDPHKLAYDLNLFDAATLAFYYARQFLSNPAFLNSSLLDTIFGFVSFYVIPHPYLYLYNFVPWIEKDITSVLTQVYDWELAQDTISTWRIGDGTAPFYNYIYYAVAGFTENDTFRSNQVREGQISRDEAWRLVRRDNAPRFDSIRWYLETIGLDVVETLNAIQRIPKLYGPDSGVNFLAGGIFPKGGSS